jgi:hypothetical protein
MAGLRHPTDHLEVRPTDHRNDAGTTGEGGPAITGSIAVVDGVPTAAVDLRSFTTFTKRAGRQLMPAAV